MARCPFCRKVLSDAWLKHQGASLMGKARGEAKARTTEQARAAAQAPRGPRRAEKEAAEFEERMALETRRKFVQPLKKKHLKKT